MQSDMYKVGVKGRDRIIKSYAREILKKYKRGLDRVRAVVSYMYEKYADAEGRLSVAAISKENIHGKIQKIIREVSDDEAYIEEKGIKDACKYGYYFTSDVIRKDSGGLIALAPIGTAVLLGYVANKKDTKGWKARIAIRSQDATRNIIGELRRSLAKGEPQTELVKRIKSTMGKSASQAKRLIETEMHRAATEGDLLAISRAEKKGVKYRRIWRASPQGWPRDHQSMDGQEADDDDLFVYPSGNQSEGPGLSGDPADDCNCKCHIEFSQVE